MSHHLGRIKHTYKSDISSSLPWQGFANYRFRSFVRICHISPAFGVPRLRRSANAFVCNGNHSSSWLVEIAVQKRPIPKKPPAIISYHRQSSQSLRQPFMRTLSMSTPRSVDCSCMTNMQYGAWRQLHSSLLNSSRHRLIKASFFIDKKSKLYERNNLLIWANKSTNMNIQAEMARAITLFSCSLCAVRFKYASVLQSAMAV